MRERFYDIRERLMEANRYGVALVLFTIWMASLAEVDIFRMVTTRIERNRIEDRIAQTENEIAALDEQIAEIERDPSVKERHARESYYMHKSNEDVFVFR